VLYKLLTGAAPHRIEGKSPVDTCARSATKTSAAPAALRPELAGDLDHILQMALRKEPQRRYSSADQFAADLRRWLADEPVLASPDTIWYRSGKFVRRHWLGVAAAAIVLLALANRRRPWPLGRPVALSAGSKTSATSPTCFFSISSSPFTTCPAPPRRDNSGKDSP
jgi:hypothetical protein